MIKYNGKAMAVYIKVSGGGVGLLEAATEEEMAAQLVDENIGQIVKYTGETTDTYENGRLYLIE